MLTLVELQDDPKGSVPLLLKRSGAIKLLGINHAYFDEYAASGIIPRVHLPGKPGWFFLREDLLAFVQSLKGHTMPAGESPRLSLKGVR